MAEKKKHTLLKAAGTAAVAGTAAYAGFGYYVFRTAFDLENSTLLSPKAGPANAGSDDAETNEWFMHSTRSDEFLDSFDGLKLHALKIMNHADSHRWIIVQHGFNSCSTDMMRMMWEADHRDYNILAPDARGYGMSEGRYTSLGWNEHYDLISWINYLLNIDRDAQIVLYGVSVGAAAVMNALGDYIPSNVKCAVEDGGFSDISQLLLNNIQHYCRINGKPFMPGIDLYVKNILHFSLNDVSTARQLKQSSTPILFMHNMNDERIPASMVFDNYYSCSSEKELFTADTDISGTPEYYTRIFEFAAKYIKD